MDSTEVTKAWARGAAEPRLRRYLPASWVLPVASFLFGVAVCAVVFVGIWRHTASQGDKAQAAKAATDRRLSAALTRINELRGKLAAQQALLTRARKDESKLTAGLASAQRTNSLIAARLPRQLAALDATAGSLARQSSTLASDLDGLQAYLANSNGSSLDPGFLGTQIEYLTAAGKGARANAARLQAQVRTTSETLSVLRHPK